MWQYRIRCLTLPGRRNKGDDDNYCLGAVASSSSSPPGVDLEVGVPAWLRAVELAPAGGFALCFLAASVARRLATAVFIEPDAHRAIKC